MKSETQMGDYSNVCEPFFLLSVIPVYTHTQCGMIGWQDIEKLYSRFLSLFFSSGNWSKRDTFVTIFFCLFACFKVALSMSLFCLPFQKSRGCSLDLELKQTFKIIH